MQNHHLLEKARKANCRLSSEEESELINELNQSTILYGIEFVKGKWSELENKIILETKRFEKSTNDWTDGLGNKLDKYIQQYSTQILGKRWAEAEKMFLELNPSSHHVEYAQKLIGRWEELEKKIIKQIIYVDKGPNDTASAGVDYSIRVLKCRWPELEKELLNQEDNYHAIHYLKNLIKNRWPELEDKLTKSSNDWAAAYQSLSYIKAIKQRVLKLEEIINKNYNTKYKYKTYIKKQIEKLLKKKNYDEILKYCDYEDYSSIIKNLYKKYFIPDILKNSILAQSLVGHRESLKALNEDKLFKNKVKNLLEELIKNNDITEDSSAKDILRVIN